MLPYNSDYCNVVHLYVLKENINNESNFVSDNDYVFNRQD